MQDIIGGVSLGKKIIGIFLYHWNFECGSLTWQCGRYLGKSFFLFLRDCWGAPFFHFLFPLWFLGTPCIPALFSTAPSLTPSLLPLPDLYDVFMSLRFDPQVSLHSSSAYTGPCKGPLPFLRGGREEVGVQLVERALVPYCLGRVVRVV